VILSHLLSFSSIMNLFHATRRSTSWCSSSFATSTMLFGSSLYFLYVHFGRTWAKHRAFGSFIRTCDISDWWIRVLRIYQNKSFWFINCISLWLFCKIILFIIKIILQYSIDIFFQFYALTCEFWKISIPPFTNRHANWFPLLWSLLEHLCHSMQNIRKYYMEYSYFFFVLFFVEVFVAPCEPQKKLLIHFLLFYFAFTHGVCLKNKIITHQNLAVSTTSMFSSGKFLTKWSEYGGSCGIEPLRQSSRI